MLILSRKIGESIVIDGRIVIKVVRVEGEVVKVGILAPADLPVHRQEVYEEIQRNNQQALTRPKGPLPKLPFRQSPQGAAAPTSAPPHARQKPAAAFVRANGNAGAAT
jgi:carbon storage regulator